MMPIKLKRKTHVRPFKLSLNRLKFRFFQNRTRSHLERDVIRIISSSFSLVVISFSNGSSIYRKCIVVKEMEAEGSGQRRGCRRWPSKFIRGHTLYMYRWLQLRRQATTGSRYWIPVTGKAKSNRCTRGAFETRSLAPPTVENK